MYCNKFCELDGCNNCKCSLTDTNYLSQFRSSSMVDILDQIIRECNSFPNDRVLLSDSTISCTGDISIVYGKSNISNTEHNKRLCYNMVDQWLKQNISSIYNAMNIVYLILCASILSYDEREQKATEMLDSMQVLFSYIQFYIKKLNNK